MYIIYKKYFAKLFLIIFFVSGVSLVKNYGISFDEESNRLYGLVNGNYILKTFISIGPFQPICHYRYHYPGYLYHSDNREGFNGVKIQTLDSNKLKGYRYCIGYGTYNDGIRVGKWFWEDKSGNKIVEGNFNDEGNPIGEWDSHGIDEVFTFSNDGELIKRIKTIID